MKKLLIVTLLIAFASMVAAGQDKVSVFGGWQYLNVDSAANANGTSRVNAPLGWDADVAFRIAPFVSVVGDVSGNYKTFDAMDVDTGDGIVRVTPKEHVHNFLFGPRISVTVGKVTPFAEGLVGLAHATAGATAQGQTVSLGSNNLAVAFGGGLDVKAGKMLSVRLVKFDYILDKVKFNTGSIVFGTQSENLNNFRIASGIVLRF